jgi:hypothetical protein
MTQLASPETVKGRFDGVPVSMQGRSFLPERRGDEFWIVMDNPQSRDAPPDEQQVIMITGSHHMQVYWYSAGDGRTVTSFPITWRIPEEQWIPYDSAFLHPASLVLESQSGRWNQVCVNCHAVHGKPRSWWRNDVDTRVAEFGISCEACHGPGEEHVLANRSPQRRYDSHFGDERDGTVKQPEHLNAAASAQICGQCHSIVEVYNLPDFRNWDDKGLRYRPGDDLHKTRFIVRPDQKETMEHPWLQELLRQDPLYLEGRFWSDGMARVSGTEFNGLLNSPCVEGGEFSCLSCHTMHQPVDDPRPLKEWANAQLRIGMDGDEACLQCHESIRSNLTEHTHHEAESTGSRCYNCHMPNTTYGLLKGLRSHQVDSPTVAASIETGRPNACNQCHLDKTLDWTNEYLADWYGTPKAELDEDERSIAASVLWALRGDAGQRALMAWSMGWTPAREASGSNWMAPYLAQLLKDPYHAVRFIALRTLKGMEGFSGFDYDFVGPPEELEVAQQQALDIWWNNRNSDSGPTDDDTSALDVLLINSDGTLQDETFQRLLKQRDDRVVDLHE